MNKDIRWNFEVSDKRKKVWSIEIQMLHEVQKICQRHDLRYYAIAGTLLGAVRHKGFIPWDDDLDIAMPRKDYDLFLRYAEKELTEKCFLQTPWTDKDYFQGHAKIRMHDTAAIRHIQWPEKFKFHQGIFIDIFPLDNIPDNPFIKRIHRKVTMRIINHINMGRYYYSMAQHTDEDVALHVKYSKKYKNDKKVIRMLAFYDKWCALFDGENTEKWGLLSGFYYRDEMFSWNRKYFEKSTIMEFEGTDIECPIEWEKILKETYGDYMRPVKGSSQHGDVFFDTEKSYEYYLKHYDEFGNIEQNYIL